MKHFTSGKAAMSGSKNETTAVNDAGEIDGKICCLNPEC